MHGLRWKLPSPNALFVFEAAARHENFSQAAVELNVTQPAVSRMIAALEAHLGTALFTRGKQGARLTPEGLRLRHVVAGAFAGIGAELDALASRPAGKAPVTLSVSTAFTAHWLTPRIDRFRAAFPGVDLRFQLIAGAVDGPAGDVDIAMRYLPRIPRDALFVMREAHVPVCAPALLAKALRGEATPIRLDPGGGDARAGAVLGFSDYAIVIQAAMIGQGVAEGWLNIVAHWLREGHLRVAAGALTHVGRHCCLLNNAPPERATVARDICLWIRDELRADLTALDRRAPTLGVAALLRA